MTTADLGPVPPPPAELRFRPDVRLRTIVREFWDARELLRTIAERQFLVRYKQALLGGLWAILTPITLMVVFTVFFKRVANIDTHGAPYALFSYLGLIPWTFFSTSVSNGGQSLVTNKILLNKVYCPREVFPISSVIVAGIDMALATLALGALFVITGYGPRSTAVFVPAMLMVQVLFTLGITIVISGVLVYLRDLQLALPIILQLGIFATPVAYGLDTIPADLRTVYCALNPLAPVIDGYRQTILFGKPPHWSLLAVGAVSSAALFIAGMLFFKRIEPGFADVA